MNINREDMLELTRRMTVKRNCFTRLAGAYMDADGFEEGSFNTHFLKLPESERERNLQIAKAIPFSETNRQLRLFPFAGGSRGTAGIRQLLLAMTGCGLKNDALLSTLYELIGENNPADAGYAVYVFHGSYDVPLKAADKERLWESEEVYDFLILCLCPLAGEYEPGMPEWGFLYPAFTGRSSDADHIAIFEAEPEHPHEALNRFLLGAGA